MEMYDDGYQFSDIIGAEYTTFGIITLAINLVAWWVLFNKAGLPGWYGIVPIFNLIYLVKVATGGSGWGAVLFFCSCCECVLCNLCALATWKSLREKLVVLFGSCANTKYFYFDFSFRRLAVRRSKG